MYSAWLRCSSLAYARYARSSRLAMQYIAVQSGWGVDARGMQTRLNSVSPGNFPEVPEGGAVWVFAVK